MTWRHLTVCIVAILPITVGCSQQMNVPYPTSTTLPMSKFLASTDIGNLIRESGAEEIEWGPSRGDGSEGRSNGNHSSYIRYGSADFRADADAGDKLLKRVADKLVEAVKKNGGQPSALKDSPNGSNRGIRFDFTEGSRVGTVQITLYLDQQAGSHPHRLDATIDEHSGE